MEGTWQHVAVAENYILINRQRGRKRKQSLGMTWAFEISKSSNKATLPNHPQKCCTLMAKHLNIGAYGVGAFLFKPPHQYNGETNYKKPELQD